MKTDIHLSMFVRYFLFRVHEMNYSNNNLKLNYDILGHGQPLVLIAGITCDNNNWQLIQDELSKSFQLIMPDNRGVGKSELPEQGYLVADMATDVIALLDELNISKATVLGHSMGGAVAQYLASHYPERVDRLIISHSFIKFRASSIMFCKHDYLLAEANSSPKLRATNILPFVYSDEFIESDENVQTFIQALANTPSNQTLESYKQQIDAISKVDSTDYIASITAKTLVLTGEFDKLAPPQDSQEIANKIKSSTLEIMPGAHVPMWEIPGQYTDLIVKFLSN